MLVSLHLVQAWHKRQGVLTAFKQRSSNCYVWSPPYDLPDIMLH